MAEWKEVPINSKVVAILPTTLDTPANRKAMPGVDYTTWEDPNQISKMMKMWGVGESWPENGAFVNFSKIKGGILMPNLV